MIPDTFVSGGQESQEDAGRAEGYAATQHSSSAH